MLHFLHFWGLNFVFSSFTDTFVSEAGRQKVKKYYEKYIPMLAIHVGNHFSDKFVPPCHIGYFINGDGRKLMVGYICRTFYIFRDSILYFHLSGMHLLANYTLRDKSSYLPIIFVNKFISPVM